jgi:hypothetical protein
MFIEDKIVFPLSNMISGHMAARDLPWHDMEAALEKCREGGCGFLSILHSKMVPYYELFFFGDPKICRFDVPMSRIFMEEVIRHDGEFKKWADKQDLIVATEGWGDNLKRSKNDHVFYYFYFLELLISNYSNQDWEKLAAKVKELLFKSEVYSDYKTDELLCILHAFTMIMQQEWEESSKRGMFIMLRENWGFMKYFYSLMTRHIVGSKLTNFAALTNAVTQNKDNLPYIHIYYCALTERMDSLGLNPKQYEKLENARMKLSEWCNRNEPSDILNELCDTLFPEDFQRLLGDMRPKTYGELEEENQRKDEIIERMQQQVSQAWDTTNRLVDTFKNAIESSIPIPDIEKRLMTLPAGTAWDIYNKLEESLRFHDNWRKYNQSLESKVLARLQEAENRQSLVNLNNPSFNSLYDIHGNQTINLEGLNNGGEEN